VPDGTIRSAPTATTLCLLAALAAIASGCGSSEESGDVGDVLEAKGLQVSVKRVDTGVPVPANDITGLSTPTPGSKLVGALVAVCSDHGGAIGPYDFGVETDSGDNGRLKFPQMNYTKGFDSLRADCGGGWVVFEVPAGSTPDRITFGFEDTGSRYNQQSQVDAKFSWAVG
jgi:hypothetical protein